jgi:NADH-quinone oxidoreductase subunit M
LLLVLQSLINASFAALNLLLFYICFELALVPMYFIIGIWGGEDRIYASYKFFLYTLFGSLLFLACIIWLFVSTSTLSIPELYSKGLVIDYASQKLLWWAMFIAFAIKIPMLPFHTWLPSAHVQAPTVGSAILAGVLLKLGAYGFTFSSPTVRVKLTQEAALAPTPSPVATVKPAAAKKATITCVKGKTSKKVTAVNPKCPTGYKKK